MLMSYIQGMKKSSMTLLMNARALLVYMIGILYNSKVHCTLMLIIIYECEAFYICISSLVIFYH